VRKVADEMRNRGPEAAGIRCRVIASSITRRRAWFPVSTDQINWPIRLPSESVIRKNALPDARFLPSGRMRMHRGFDEPEHAFQTLGSGKYRFTS